MLSRLYILLLLALVSWSSWEIFGIWCVLVCAFIFAISLFIARSWSLAVFFAVVTLCSIVIALLLPAISCAREAARQMQCANQLKQIALALQNYKEANKCFPPACIADKDGKPMHSWRVLILPYLDEEPLYNQYNFNEPWNGPNNKELLANRPRVFACPSDERANSQNATCTSYIAVVGEKTAWNNCIAKNPNGNDLREKQDSSVLVIESAGANIGWTEPRDLSVDHLPGEITPQESQVTASSNHKESKGFFFHDIPIAQAAMMNVTTRSLPTDLPGLKELLSIGGCSKEKLSSWSNYRVHWLNTASLAVWLLSVGLLFHQAFRRRKRLKTLANASP